MLSPIVTSLSIITVSLMFGAALLVAWRQFGLRAHAPLWALSFMFSAVGHGVRIIGVMAPEYQSVNAMLACHASIGSFALLAMGFRARAGMDNRLTAFLWILTSAAVLALWILQPVEWRYGSRFVTGAADAALVSLIVLMPRGGRLSPSIRAALSLYGLYVLSVGVAGWLARPGGTISEDAFVILLSLGTPTGMIATGVLTLFILAADLAGDLRKQAQYDYLTGLLNRRGFEEELAVKYAATNKAGFIVATDLDRFKSVNDRFGHATGDEVIRRFAEHIRSYLGPDDLAGRMGGEEFAIFLASRDGRETLSRIETLRNEVPGRFTDIDMPDPITASFGIVRLKPEETFQQAYARADESLYRSKRAGRNRTFADMGEAA
ncbi:GGDEF domain-containing protein [Fulvimarina endophytica]|uniref:diguanylate cyclase n=1 Tax=Fulvimarina endophytica TaxID=2293836 RepID=A0A371X3E9_9HYPH|nr:GGDEF domain-containing protein [Fulvimarina endophytica]RFC63755.1 GGDEF domain-containing protein [Fulvimarina endophytica]